MRLPGRVLQQRADFLHVLPDVALALRAAEQERGMERRDQLRAAVLVNAPAQARDRLLRLQQRFRRKRAERHDDLRTDAVDLPEEEALAGLDLVRVRVAVPWRPALDHVGDVDVAAL